MLGDIDTHLQRLHAKESIQVPLKASGDMLQIDSHHLRQPNICGVWGRGGG